MGNLLMTLHTETFVLNTRNPVAAPPAVPGFVMRLVDEHTLEVDISKDQNLNELFSCLTVLDIDVLSMRNKVNRLEEIFMRLVENRGSHAG
jgi:ABC-2 type transport system ATP-binding protein